MSTCLRRCSKWCQTLTLHITVGLTRIQVALEYLRVLTGVSSQVNISPWRKLVALCTLLIWLRRWCVAGFRRMGLQTVGLFTLRTFWSAPWLQSKHNVMWHFSAYWTNVLPSYDPFITQKYPLCLCSISWSMQRSWFYFETRFLFQS